MAGRYAGRHVAVAGRGASAQNALVALALAGPERHPGTRVSWLVRRGDTDQAFGGGDNDQLVARGALGKSARGRSRTAPSPPSPASAPPRSTSHRRPLTLTSIDGQQVTDVDEVIVVTGFRPDHSWLSEVHLDLDGELSAPSALAPEIHPAYHSCGSVSPHGANLLRQPEGDLYLVGMKSYGRAPSFLTLTGYEQTRSVVAEIAGDYESADRVELVLPDSGRVRRLRSLRGAAGRRRLLRSDRQGCTRAADHRRAQSRGRCRPARSSRTRTPCRTGCCG